MALSVTFAKLFLHTRKICFHSSNGNASFSFIYEKIFLLSKNITSYIYTTDNETTKRYHVIMPKSIDYRNYRFRYLCFFGS